MIYRLGALAKEAGFRGIWAGLGPRMSTSSAVERYQSSLK